MKRVFEDPWLEWRENMKFARSMFYWKFGFAVATCIYLSICVCMWVKRVYIYFILTRVALDQGHFLTFAGRKGRNEKRRELLLVMLLDNIASSSCKNIVRNFINPAHTCIARARPYRILISLANWEHDSTLCIKCHCTAL